MGQRELQKAAFKAGLLAAVPQQPKSGKYLKSNLLAALTGHIPYILIHILRKKIHTDSFLEARIPFGRLLPNYLANEARTESGVTPSLPNSH